MKNKNLSIIIIGILVIAIAIYFFIGIPQSTDQETSDDEVKGVEIEGYKEISVEKTKKLLDENPQDWIVLDVSPKYTEGHIPGAINYYVGDGSLDAAIPNLDKTAQYIVYCHIASASRQGAQKLVDAGFETVYRLTGDYSGWVEAGYPIEQ